MPALPEMADGGPTKAHSGTAVFRHIVSKSPNPIEARCARYKSVYIYPAFQLPPIKQRREERRAGAGHETSSGTIDLERDRMDEKSQLRMASTVRSMNDQR